VFSSFLVTSTTFPPHSPSLKVSKLAAPKRDGIPVAREEQHALVILAAANSSSGDVLMYASLADCLGSDKALKQLGDVVSKAETPEVLTEVAEVSAIFSFA
jgi:hypothetical protein